ncbi:hypothetical protein ILUMI_24630 [Ignelater luminosus]|uniref:Uncharacterized protein n=1 Tax=Ignelater luminosus TaxID=2038154 RepID=A0A8K0C5X5_IGNLU|nr:hypothetical protein ILUMI_24630 [Ignelater luminosus]
MATQYIRRESKSYLPSYETKDNRATCPIKTYAIQKKYILLGLQNRQQQLLSTRYHLQNYVLKGISLNFQIGKGQMVPNLDYTADGLVKESCNRQEIVRTLGSDIVKALAMVDTAILQTSGLVTSGGLSLLEPYSIDLRPHETTYLDITSVYEVEGDAKVKEKSFGVHGQRKESVDGKPVRGENQADGLVEDCDNQNKACPLKSALNVKVIGNVKRIKNDIERSTVEKFYGDNINRRKLFTVRHFMESKVPKRTNYNILQRFEENITAERRVGSERKAVKLNRRRLNALKLQLENSNSKVTYTRRFTGRQT